MKILKYKKGKKNEYKILTDDGEYILYDDIIIYGKEDFDVSIHCTKTTKENVLYSKEWYLIDFDLVY